MARTQLSSTRLSGTPGGVPIRVRGNLTSERIGQDVVLSFGDVYPISSPTILVDDTLNLVLREIRALRASVEQLSAHIIGQEDTSIGPSHEGMPATANISDTEAKEAIKQYFAKHHGRDIFPDEVADAIGLELVRTIRLCEELMKENRIARVHPE